MTTAPEDSKESTPTEDELALASIRGRYRTERDKRLRRAGLDYHDQPAVRAIVDDAAASEFRWSALIVGVVKSPAFLMRTAGTPVEPNAE